jgi:SAM-dependent methyltransferase
LVSCSRCSLGFFTPAVEASIGLYQELARLPWYYLSEKPEYEFAKRFVEAGTSVLDVGCGDAAFAEYIEGARYVGIEQNPGAVQRARDRGIEVEQSLLEEFSGLGRSRFDVVCAFQVLEHVPQPGRFLDQLRGLARPGGTIIVSVPAADSFVSLEVNEPLNLPPHHLTWWFDRALDKIAEIKDLDLIWLHHETLSEQFRLRYARCLVNEVLARVLSRERKVVDCSWLGVASLRLSSLLGRLVGVGLRNPRLSPRGHSVTAVFRKRALQ